MFWYSYLSERAHNKTKYSSSSQDNRTGSSNQNDNDSDSKESTMETCRVHMKRKRNEKISFDHMVDKTENTKPRKFKKLALKEKIRTEAPDNEFMINEIVLVTIPEFCPWPASITMITGETMMVQFFGTGEMSVKVYFFSTKSNLLMNTFFFRNPVRSNAVSRFELNRTIPLLQRKGYRKAMQELELTNQVPENISLFKQ